MKNTYYFRDQKDVMILPDAEVTVVVRGEE